MTVASGIQYGSGFRQGRVYEIDQVTGRLKGNSPTVPYMGYNFTGNKAWSLTIPKQRRINHIDADRVGAADFLPPTEAASGSIAVGADNQVIDAILTGNKKTTIGEASMIADLTSNQGFEPLVALLLWQQSLDSSTRLRTWRSFLVPRAKAIPMPSGFGDREIDGSYDILMTPSSVNMFGVSLSTSFDGATDAQLFRSMTAGRPAIAAWVGDGATVTFTFPVSGYSPARSVASVAVYKNGVLVTAGITVTTLDVTFAVAPAANDDICIFWEY